MVSRREFFTRKKQQKFLLPPWASLENFEELCTQCDKCIEICPEKILYKTQNNYPAISFKHAGCDFCGKCNKACESNAINKKENPAFTHTLNVSNDCMAKKGITCRSCVESCDEDAFVIKLKLRGKINIFINAEECTGCGECISVCPDKAIKVSSNQSSAIS